MELERVIETLEKHQEWRRDQNVPPKTKMQSPTEIGAAIDYAISELKKLLSSDVVRQSEQLPCDCNVKLAKTTLQIYCPKCYKTHKMK